MVHTGYDVADGIKSFDQSINVRLSTFFDTSTE